MLVDPCCLVQFFSSLYSFFHSVPFFFVLLSSSLEQQKERTAARQVWHGLQLRTHRLKTAAAWLCQIDSGGGDETVMW
jgi:hypothetical protein